MEVQTKETKRKSTVAWVMTIIVVVVAILSAAFGVYGLIHGFDNEGQPDKFVGFSIPSIVLGLVVAILAGWTFSRPIENKSVWWSIQILWTLCSVGLIVDGVLGSIAINAKEGLTWIPICVTINGGILLGDKIQYLIAHFDRLNKEAKNSAQPQQ